MIVYFHLRKSENFSVFKSNILKLIQTSPKSSMAQSPMTSYMLNPLRRCGNDMESTEHFLFHCPQFVNGRRTFLSGLGNFNCSLFENTNNVFTQTLLFGNTSYSASDNSKILSATIDFISSTKRFDKQLF